MLNRMNLSVQIVAQILSMKITILLVRDFTNVVLPVSNNLIDRQPYGFYNIQYLITDIHPMQDVIVDEICQKLAEYLKHFLAGPCSDHLCSHWKFCILLSCKPKSPQPQLTNLYSALGKANT